MGFPRVVGLTAVVPILLLLTLSGCTSSQRDQPSGTGSVGVLTPGLAAKPFQDVLPAPSSLIGSQSGTAAALPRGTTYVPADLVKNGDEYAPALPNNKAWLLGSSLVLQSWLPTAECELADVAYACFHFEITGYDGSSMLRLDWSDAPMQSDWWYVALANWDNDRWDFFVGNEDSRITPDSLDPYLDFGGDLLAVVFCTGYLSGILDRIWVGGTPPIARLSVSDISGAVPFDVTFWADDSLPIEGALTRFEWDLDADGIYETDTGTVDHVDHTYLANGEYQARLRVTNTSGATDTDNLIVNAIGGWGHSWGLSANDSIKDVLATSDGSIFAVGETTRPSGTGDKSLLLLRLSPTGILVWAKTWDTGDTEYGNRILQAENGDLIVVGSYRSGSDYDALVQLWNRSGQVVWSHSYGGTRHDEATAVCESNNIIYVAGDTRSTPSGDSDAFICQLDPLGTHYWGYGRDRGNSEYVTDMCCRDDTASQIQDLIMVGYSLPLGMDYIPFAWKVEYYADGVFRSQNDLEGPAFLAIARAVAQVPGATIAEERIFTGVQLVEPPVQRICLLAHDGAGNAKLGTRWLADGDCAVTDILLPDASTVLLCGSGVSDQPVGMLWQFSALTGAAQHAYAWDADIRFNAIAESRYGIVLASSAANNDGVWSEWSDPTYSIDADWVTAPGSAVDLEWAWDIEAVGNVDDITDELQATEDAGAGAGDVLMLHRLSE